eukprot:scaffold3118_cov64-Cylindrotheca_fusiformis.AAC.3
MSFYFEDDDDFEPSSSSFQPFASLSGNTTTTNNTTTQNKSKNNNAEKSFVCDSCGGTQSYMDETTGNLTCTECFTQSQTIVAASQMEMDMEDAMGLAGRSRGGQLMGRPGSNNKNRSSTNKRRGRSLKEHDTSERLPDTLECIGAMQRVLQESTRILCEIAGSKKSFTDVFTTVKAMWEAYLRSWKDGADYYAPLYPEVRFHFRDHFLTYFQRTILSKTLSYMAAKRLKDEVAQEEKVKFEEEEEDEGSDSDDYNDNDLREVLVPDKKVRQEDDDDSKCSELSTDVVPTVNKRDYDRSAITLMIQRHLKRDSKTRISYVGRKEAALMLEPNMLMVACILLTATSPLGITLNHIRRWIANGSLPLLNAFTLLTPKQQEDSSLKLIAQSFRMSSVPSVRTMERMLTNVNIACGYKARPIVIRRQRTKRTIISQASKSYTAGRIILPSHVPVITARFVADFGMNQQVLNYALSIMGHPIKQNGGTTGGNDNHSSSSSSSSLWIPPALKKARPDFLLQTTRILAVIVVACKMIPGWEDMKFEVPASSDDNDDTAPNHHRFVPRSAAHFQFLRNGPLMKNYLDFMETIVLKKNTNDNTVLPQFVKALEEQQEKTIVQPKESSSVATTGAVRPNNTFLMCRSDDPATTSTMNNENDEEGKEKEDDSLFQYLLTDRMPKENGWQLRPPLGPLLEYMAYKTATNPMEILDFVAELDEEILHKCNKYNGRI